MRYNRRMSKTEKFLLNPLCAGVIVLILLMLCKAIVAVFYANQGFDFFDTQHGLEYITYGLYIGAGAIAIKYRGLFLKTNQRKDYFSLLFLWLAAFLREMGIQHWLTNHDTTAIKLRFFTNPNNPLHEKIISGILVIAVLGVALSLFIKYIPKIWWGFWKLNPLYWTITTFGGVLLISQFCDRFPSKYFKATHENLSPLILEWLKLFEEGGEASLPILFALGFIQYARLKKK